MGRLNVFSFLVLMNLGSGLLVNTVTAGLIMIIKPFRTNRRPFIKDVLFYMVAVSWSAAILIRCSINLSDSVGMSFLSYSDSEGAVFVLLVPSLAK